MRALEDSYDEGKLRSIGVFNFYVDRMVDFVKFNRIGPMVNQMETNPLNQQTELLEWAKKYNIQLEAWAPLGEGRGGLFTNPVLTSIGDKYGKSAAQVMLRWSIQRGVVVLPKTVHRERMKQNIEVFDFELSGEDMDAIATLDTNTSQFFDHRSPEAVERLYDLVEERRRDPQSSF